MVGLQKSLKLPGRWKYIPQKDGTVLVLTLPTPCTKPPLLATYREDIGLLESLV